MVRQYYGWQGKSRELRVVAWSGVEWRGVTTARRHVGLRGGRRGTAKSDLTRGRADAAPCGLALLRTSDRLDLNMNYRRLTSAVSQC